jgi:hypothetical protein
MKITQEEKVLVAVTKKEAPPRARGTEAFSYVSVALSCSLYKYTG